MPRTAKWKPVSGLRESFRLVRLETCASPANAGRLRKFLQTEVVHGTVLAAMERREGQSVRFRIVVPTQQSPEFQIRLARHVPCTIPDERPIQKSRRRKRTFPSFTELIELEEKHGANLGGPVPRRHRKGRKEKMSEAEEQAALEYFLPGMGGIE
jgi:hypothetical protein